MFFFYTRHHRCHCLIYAAVSTWWVILDGGVICISCLIYWSLFLVVKFPICLFLFSSVFCDSFLLIWFVHDNCLLFHRSEIDHLVELMHSRSVDTAVGEEGKKTEVVPLESMLPLNQKEEYPRTPAVENGIKIHPVSTSHATSSVWWQFSSYLSLMYICVSLYVMDVELKPYHDLFDMYNHILCIGFCWRCCFTRTTSKSLHWKQAFQGIPINVKHAKSYWGGFNFTKRPPFCSKIPYYVSCAKGY